MVVPCDDIVMVDLVYLIQLAEKCGQVVLESIGARSAIAPKVADAVVNGATSAT